VGAGDLRELFGIAPTPDFAMLSHPLPRERAEKRCCVLQHRFRVSKKPQTVKTRDKKAQKAFSLWEKVAKIFDF